MEKTCISFLDLLIKKLSGYLISLNFKHPVSWLIKLNNVHIEGSHTIWYATFYTATVIAAHIHWLVSPCHPRVAWPISKGGIQYHCKSYWITLSRTLKPIYIYIKSSKLFLKVSDSFFISLELIKIKLCFSKQLQH